MRRRPNAWNAEHISAHPPWKQRGVAATQREPAQAESHGNVSQPERLLVCANLAKLFIGGVPCSRGASLPAGSKVKLETTLRPSSGALSPSPSQNKTEISKQPPCLACVTEGTGKDICFSLPCRRRRVTLAGK